MAENWAGELEKKSAVSSADQMDNQSVVRKEIKMVRARVVW